MRIGRHIDKRLKGNERGHSLRDFFTNSAYFPLTNILLELLTKEQKGYLPEPAPYLLLFAALIQAWFLSHRQFHGRPLPLLGDLIGPLIYTIIEIAMEGNVFATELNHLAYRGFAFAIGTLQ